ncbi:hypothetical protein TRFO_19728 [Tritrichomonas foetus]|uniref:Uncharacterized protein n=1 Tax=Tritrichomonas foetus TaxID=1144522 RepID=A0A1J4KHK0_9EUKA|nr:hypothetical protein TRFO_19728 [Tritrichomonas foetus]|eukprot:OHT10841.1 hypothetical protein TRFO_19728 [Tritrichomonas foetus]
MEHFQLSGHSDEAQKIRVELDRFTKVEQDIHLKPIENIWSAVISRHAEAIHQGTHLLTGAISFYYFYLAVINQLHNHSLNSNFFSFTTLIDSSMISMNKLNKFD